MAPGQATQHYIHGRSQNTHKCFADTCNQQPNIKFTTPGQTDNHNCSRDTCNQQPSIIFKALDRINIIFIAAHANSNQHGPRPIKSEFLRQQNIEQSPASSLNSKWYYTIGTRV